ncbi:MAG: UvrD-helicase domain-containing protein [Cyanomargarita calcarea GSE-NOS-MK-12-04C]|uniref:UvrD-helicase domain-containing protein n=1 Tax=Cyanomargarita calcarea GSE-NOS-MK-12-04C TaxID=2839659 RepID=A0A951UQP1_9CYAN|nr:UvrD-helicase domain-containing protein [Cyanomargarita calcarea GSE-NOS-MK-12-04C]
MPQYTPNSEQQKIINHIKGAILVLAPVGTGKTLVLKRASCTGNKKRYSC